MGDVAGTKDEALLQLEAQLKAPDAIMEPGVNEVIQKYMQAGGKPSDIIDMLSDGYVGYAQMASLVCSWISMVEDVAPVPTAGSSSRASSSTAAGAAGVAPQPDAGAAGPLDETAFLQDLVKERFDPQPFLSVFRGAPPAWLGPLISDRRGRQLVYDLSAVHKRALLLNFVVQRIMQAGHDAEVASYGSSLAYYFEVYHRLLATSLGNAADAHDTAKLTQLAAEFRDSCTASEHTYAHAQQILCSLAALPGGSVMRRLSQEIEAAAAASVGGKVWAHRVMFVPPGVPPQQYEATMLVGEVLKGAAHEAPGPAALQRTQGSLRRLRELFDGAFSTPLEPLRHPKLMQLLLDGYFTPGASATAFRQVQEAAQHLLAVAVAATEQFDPHSGAFRRLDTAEVPAVAAKLEAAAALVTDALRGVTPDAARGGKVCDTPVASLGVLRSLRAVWGAGAAAAEERSSSSAEALLQLLALVAAAQPALMDEVLQALASALGVLGSRTDLARAHLAQLITLITANEQRCAQEGMAVAEDWAQSADPSLVRHFILQLLECVAPPYSQAFARVLLRVMVRASIGRVIAAGKETAKYLLAEFASGCQALRFQPPLSAAEVALLNDLARGLGGGMR